MKTHAFFLTPPEGGFPENGSRFDVSDEALVHQWSRVLRLEPGEEVMLYDGAGAEAKVEVISLSKASATVEVKAVGANAAAERAARRDLTVYMSLIKGDRLEWAVQKCAELGVSRFVPVVSARTIKKEANVDRLRAIAREACEQSMNARLMEVSDALQLEDAIDEAVSAGKTLVACVISDQVGTAAPVHDVLTASGIAAFVGPEGGFTPEEDALLVSKGARAIDLGPSILRAETAAIAVACLQLVSN